MSSLPYLPRLDHSLSGDDVRPHLGAVLLKSKLLTPEQLDEALREQAGSGRRLVDVRAASRLHPEVGQRCSAIGVRMLTDGTLLVAVADPTSESLTEVRQAVDGPVAFAVTEAD